MNRQPAQLQLLGIQVGAVRPLQVGDQRVMSGFRKHATRGAVAVSALGLAGDEQADLTVLGGLAKAVYRGTFRPSSRLARPHVMLALNVVAADSEIEARRLFTSQQLGFINLRRGRPGLVQPPVEDITAVSTPEERAGVDRALACAAVGAPETVGRDIAAFVARYRPDERMLWRFQPREWVFT